MRRSPSLSSMTSSRGSFEIDEAQFEVLLQGGHRCEWSDIDVELARLSNTDSTMAAHVELERLSNTDSTFDMDWCIPVSDLPSSVTIEEIDDPPPGTNVMNAAADALAGRDILSQLAIHADDDAVRRLRTPVQAAAVGQLVKNLPKQQRNSKPKMHKPVVPKVEKAKPSAASGKKVEKAKPSAASGKKVKKATPAAASKAPVQPADAKSLHHFQSRRFQAANRRAVNMGYSDEDRTAYRKAAYSEATIEWNKFYNLA